MPQSENDAGAYGMANEIIGWLIFIVPPVTGYFAASLCSDFGLAFWAFILGCFAGGIATVSLEAPLRGILQALRVRKEHHVDTADHGDGAGYFLMFLGIGVVILLVVARGCEDAEEARQFQKLPPTMRRELEWERKNAPNEWDVDRGYPW